MFVRSPCRWVKIFFNDKPCGSGKNVVACRVQGRVSGYVDLDKYDMLAVRNTSGPVALPPQLDVRSANRSGRVAEG